MNRRKVAAILGASVIGTSLLFFCVSNLLAHIPPGVTLVDGRMTGGGSIFTGDDDFVADSTGPGTEVRVTHGFELRCRADATPNNLEINIHTPNGSGSRFHLLQLTDAACWDDPSISPNPPSAPFDTYFGRGVGEYNGQPGYCAQWTFTDAGEPGTEDRIFYLLIWTGSSCSIGDPSQPETVAIGISEPGHPLTFGDHQAHKLTGNK